MNTMKKLKLLIFAILLFFGSVSAQIGTIEVYVGGGETIVVSCEDTTHFSVIIDNLVILDIEASCQKISFESKGMLFKKKAYKKYKESSIVIHDSCILEIQFPETNNLFYLEIILSHDSWTIINPTIAALEKL